MTFGGKRSETERYVISSYLLIIHSRWHSIRNAKKRKTIFVFLVIA